MKEMKEEYACELDLPAGLNGINYTGNYHRTNQKVPHPTNQYAKRTLGFDEAMVNMK